MPDDHRRAFLVIILKSYPYWPRAELLRWADSQFAALVRGQRSAGIIGDASMTAWFLTVPGWVMEGARAQSVREERHIAARAARRS